MHDGVTTPAVLIDESRMRANIDRMQSLADRHRLVLRPHIKTHKSLELARIQSDAGAFGFTASKPDEAAVFAGRVPSLTVAYPLLDADTIVSLLDRAGDTLLQLVVDSPETVAAAVAAAARRDRPISVLIEIDVGLRRCGVRPEPSALLPIARSVADVSMLSLAGILSHAGHAYAASDRDAVARIAVEERQAMSLARQILAEEGIASPTVSVGATPTVLAVDDFAGIDEIRPGNYIFLDAIQVSLGVARFDDVALSVASTVIARNEDYYIVDAGSKTLSSDRGAHGAEGVTGFGAAFVGEVIDDGERHVIVRVSEEHGFIERGGTDLKIGTRLRIVPNHACPVVNLTDRLLLVSHDGVRPINVDARGRVAGAMRRR